MNLGIYFKFIWEMKDGKEGKMHVIPLMPIRRIIELYCPYHISTEAVIALRDVLEGIGATIAKNAVKEFKKLNECREKQGLKPLKRLNAWSVENSLFSNNYLYRRKNKNWDCAPIRDIIPGGEKVSADIPAKPDRSTDRREVA